VGGGCRGERDDSKKRTNVEDRVIQKKNLGHLLHLREKKIYEKRKVLDEG